MMSFFKNDDGPDVTIKEFLDDESGAEVIETVLLMPIFILLFLFLLYWSFYPYARSMMMNVASEGADMVSIYGGNNGPYAPTRVINAGGVDKYVKQNVNSNVHSAFVKVGGDHDWTMTCTPESANNVGDSVKCTVTYYYAPVFNPFAMASILNNPNMQYLVGQSTVSKTAFSEVGNLS